MTESTEDFRPHPDDANVRRYLDNLQKSVGKGEIGLAEYERISDLIIGAALEGEAVSIPETTEKTNKPDSSPDREWLDHWSLCSDLPGAMDPFDDRLNRNILASMTATWSAALAINVVVWLFVSFSVDNLYFWPMWVALPGILLLIAWISLGFNRRDR